MRPPGGPNQPIENFTLTVTGTNGTTMTYVWRAGAFRCSEIKDRNGNLITVSHDQYGLLRSDTDTLGRVINVEAEQVKERRLPTAAMSIIESKIWFSRQE